MKLHAASLCRPSLAPANFLQFRSQISHLTVRSFTLSLLPLELDLPVATTCSWSPILAHKDTILTYAFLAPTHATSQPLCFSSTNFRQQLFLANCVSHSGKHTRAHLLRFLCACCLMQSTTVFPTLHTFKTPFNNTSKGCETRARSFTTS